VGKKRIERIMRENGLHAKQPKRFKTTTDSNHQLRVAPNELDQNFEVSGPDQAWVTDITYLRTLEGWMFLAVVIDLFARRVVGWAIADHMRTELAMDALSMALTTRCPDQRLVHHSDRGVQYASDAYRAALDERGIICSMSRSGNCWDNAVAESFFGRLKVELVGDTIWSSKEAAKRDVGEYIDVFYNYRRRHSHNEFLTPVEAELVATQLANAA
jgi:transposase InsO family protein